MKAAVILALVMLAGCDGLDPAAEPEWEAAPRLRACTVEQMVRVQSEAKFCNDNTSYFSTFCYGSAILRNCPTPL